jgi:hypothetical protein
MDTRKLKKINVSKKKKTIANIANSAIELKT